VLLIGTDTLKTIAGWKDVELFLSDHELCVGIRDDETIDSIKADISSIEEELGVKIKYYVATIPHKAISSTKIRSAPGYNSL
jgi:nicotinic acid mononucleotide adenylyltransferase